MLMKRLGQYFADDWAYAKQFSVTRERISCWPSGRDTSAEMCIAVLDNYDLKSHKYVCITTYQPDTQV